ncbi:MAG: ATP-binding cassette domain-containing protein [Spirochaetes bacterium]|nr:ATP-binding cassette domain-containing protein [Spirochaetota bacterium]
MANVRLEHVYKNYRDVKAVIDANWECNDGEVVSILGPSGCGKSSSLRMIAGLEEISNGSIYIGDRRVNELSPAERNIALAFENYALYPHMTVRQNISYPLKIRNVEISEIKKRCDQILTMLDLHDISGYKVTGLSGGQKQRTSLGRALIREPDVFLLDEPISHLDVKLRAKMRDDLKSLLKRTGHTAIYVTHDQLEAMTVADRIVVMNLGEIQQIGTPMEVYERPQNKFVATFIGEPSMNLIPGSLKKQGGKNIFSINGQNMEVPAEVQVEKAAKEGKVSFGVRPTECFLSLTEKKGWLKGKVYTITKGIDTAVYQIDIDANHVRIVAERTVGGTIGDTAWVSFDFQHSRFFSEETGGRINLSK